MVPVQWRKEMFKLFRKRFKRPAGSPGTGMLFERLEERVLLSAALDVDKDVSGSSETDTNGTDLAVGEEVTYQITATLPEGVTNTVTLTDTLPDNIDFIAGTLSVTPNGPISTDYVDEATSVTYVGDVLTINLGTVINVFDGDPTNDTITITFTGVVRNDSVNQNGDTLTNSVELTDGTNTESDTVDVDIVEPELDVDKDIVGGFTSFEAGDSVTYTILVSHGTGSTSSAFEIDVSDTLPVEISSPTLVSASIIELGQADVDVTASFSFVGGVLTTTGDVDLLLSGVGGNPQSLSIVLSGTVDAAVPVTTIVSNSVDLTWTSINGASANERTGVGGGPNDYFGSDVTAFTVVDPPPPPEPPPPPPEPDPDPPGSPDPVPLPDPFNFVYDSLRDDSIEPVGVLEYEIPGLDYVLPGLPVAPLYTGTALPGATLVVRLTDVDGHEIAENSLVVGPDGNWLISFPTAYLEDYPYGIEVRHELMLTTQIGDSKLDELSLQYTPATNIISLFKYSLNTEWVYHETAGRSLEIMHNFVTRPII